MTFYLIVGAAYLFSMLVQTTLKRTYAKWSRVENSAGLPGGRVWRGRSWTRTTCVAYGWRR